MAGPAVPVLSAVGAAPGRAYYRLERLRPLESSQWLVTYERRQIGVPLYVWTVTQLAAGFVGWLIVRTLDGWAGRG